MLVEAHPGADDRSLADDDAGAVIDEEAFADRRAGVDVDAGPLVGEFGDQPRDDRRAQAVQLVCDTVVEAGDRTGVADENFVSAARRGVAEERGLDIAVDQPADVAECIGEQANDRGRLIRVKGATRLRLPIAELMTDLALQFGEGGGELGGDEPVLVRGCDRLKAEAAGIQRLGKELDDPLDRAARRKGGAGRCLPRPPVVSGGAQRIHRLAERCAAGPYRPGDGGGHRRSRRRA
jgi:ADP-ribose pyrophosphatase YjhB (NUDIX family)